jgi:hypothetical protein
MKGLFAKTKFHERTIPPAAALCGLVYSIRNSFPAYNELTVLVNFAYVGVTTGASLLGGFMAASAIHHYRLMTFKSVNDEKSVKDEQMLETKKD